MNNKNAEISSNFLRNSIEMKPMETKDPITKVEVTDIDTMFCEIVKYSPAFDKDEKKVTAKK